MAGEPIPYGRQSVTQEDVDAVTEVLQGDWLTQGPTVGEFECALAGVTGARYATAVCNGTAGLHLACVAAGLKPGDIGVTAAVSFVASANCMEYCGAEVRFSDVEPDTGLVSLESLGQVLDDIRTEGLQARLIVPVDMAGQSASLGDIAGLAATAGARVLSDAAHSLGGSYMVDGETFASGSCAHTDFAELSFHPVKNITTGEGGAVTTNDPGLARRLNELRTHGIHKDAARLTLDDADPYFGPWYYEQEDLGFNFRITDIQCALGVSQLGRLEAFMTRRREIAARYDAALAPFAEHLRPTRTLPGNTSAYHLYVVQVQPREGEAAESVAARRKSLYTWLHEAGIQVQIHYVPITWQPYYRDKYGFGRDDFPGARDYYARSLSLPMYPGLTNAQVDRVIESVSEWVKSL